MGEAREIIKKICLLGDPAVGKTSLIRRFVFDMFDDKYITTIGTKVTKKSLNLSSRGQEIKLTLLIWDILGQKEYARLHPVYYQGAEAALIVCDGTRNETMASLPTWASTFTKVVGSVPLIFLVNKSDMLDQTTFDNSDVNNVAKAFSTRFFFTSAKSGLNVENAFQSLCESLAKTVT